MKRITPTADDVLIQEARHQATREGTTHNDLFRALLALHVTEPSSWQLESLMAHLDHVRSAGWCSREDAQAGQ
jgi:hypothetical protein